MKKKILTTVWLLVPILLLAFHYGPGQTGLALDKTGELLKKAAQAEKNEAWVEAVEIYDQALAALPPGQSATRYRIQLGKSKARMYSGELPEAMLDLENLLADMLREKADPAQIREVRGTLGSTQYYVAWLMRLEGAGPEEWTLPVDEARQNFRLLAEETEKSRLTGEAENYKKNLESAIRLARMDISELQSLPLPSECKGCKNCSQKCRKQRQSKKKEGEKPEEPKDSRSAGSGNRPSGSGS
jgi:hypothetical protein